MPSYYQSTPYQPAFTGSISDLLMRGPEAYAQAIREAAQARAQAAEIGGQAKASIASSIGSVIPQTIAAKTQADQIAMQRQLQGAQLADMKAQADQRSLATEEAKNQQIDMQAISAAVRKNTGPDGAVNHQGVVNDLQTIRPRAVSAYVKEASGTEALLHPALEKFGPGDVGVDRRTNQSVITVAKPPTAADLEAKYIGLGANKAQGKTLSAEDAAFMQGYEQAHPNTETTTTTKEINVDGKYFGSAIYDPKAKQYLDPQTQKPISGKITEHYNPPASVQINNAANAAWTDDQIDFYAKQVKDDASKMNLVSGLEKPVRDRIERRIADLGGNVNKLSQASRTMREMATEILPHMDPIQQEAEQLNQLGLLGPIAGRWREFLAGKLGAGELAGGNAKTAQLIGKFRTDAGLLTTAVMKAHTGSRGSSQMLDHFSELLSADKADISTFTGELSGFKDWMKGYSQMGSDANTGGNWIDLGGGVRVREK